MKRTPPCYGCTERHRNCHSDCEKYISYTKICEEEKQKRIECLNAENDVIVTRTHRKRVNH